MNIKDWAVLLNGREYLTELTKKEESIAKKNGVVIVFGGSDDLIEFRGAIHGEEGAPGIIYVNENGIFENECEFENCPYCIKESEKVKRIEAIWCDVQSEFAWEYKTDIQHEKFVIYDNGESYCHGIVFNLKDAK